MVSLAILATSAAMSAQDRYILKVPGGLAFSEFKIYETWQLISINHNGTKLDVILGNPAMIEALKAGIPDNGKAFPDGVSGLRSDRRRRQAALTSRAAPTIRRRW
jgi:hypothetical protein